MDADGNRCQARSARDDMCPLPNRYGRTRRRPAGVGVSSPCRCPSLLGRWRDHARRRPCTRVTRVPTMGRGRYAIIIRCRTARRRPLERAVTHRASEWSRKGDPGYASREGRDGGPAAGACDGLGGQRRRTWRAELVGDGALPQLDREGRGVRPRRRGGGQDLQLRRGHRAGGPRQARRPDHRAVLSQAPQHQPVARARTPSSISPADPGRRAATRSARTRPGTRT